MIHLVKLVMANEGWDCTYWKSEPEQMDFETIVAFLIAAI